ncbi:MAG: phosphoribosyltransferase, partial [Nocardioides sp.]|nr:phosphoribosyltransferase [Nocardioides sp.]
LAAADVSMTYVETVESHFDGPSGVAAEARAEATRLLATDRAPTWSGWAAVEEVSAAYGIGDVNLVKPGVGETTRVLLRRVPWRVLVRPDRRHELGHVELLAEQRGVPVEVVDDLAYSCMGLIHPRFTRSES